MAPVADWGADLGHLAIVVGVILCLLGLWWGWTRECSIRVRLQRELMQAEPVLRRARVEMLTVTKALDDVIHVGCKCGYQLAIELQVGKEPGTVNVTCWGSGGLKVAEESEVKDVHWLIRPKAKTGE